MKISITKNIVNSIDFRKKVCYNDKKTENLYKKEIRIR